MARRECPVEHCPDPVRHAQLMCRRHWWLVPRTIRDRVWSTWRAYTNNRGTLEDYAEARDEAIAAATEAARQGTLV